MINRKDIKLTKSQIMEFLGLAGFKKEMLGLVHFHEQDTDVISKSEELKIVFDTEIGSTDFVIDVENLANLYNITKEKAEAVLKRVVDNTDIQIASWDVISNMIIEGVVKL